MKFLVSLFLMLSLNAMADITVINESNKASPATVFAMSVKNNINDSTFYQSQTCEDAFSKFNTTENSVLVYNSSVEFAARERGLNCKLSDIKNAKIVYIGKQYMNVCTTNSSKFGNTKFTMGMPSMYSTKGHESDFIKNGVDVKLIPFGGSKDIVNAVSNGDIDYGYIANSMSNGFNCIYSTNPNDDNFIGKKYKLLVPDFRVTYVLVTNIQDKDLLHKVSSLESNKDFMTYIKSSETYSDWDITKNDVEAVIKFVDTLSSSWGAK